MGAAMHGYAQPRLPGVGMLGSGLMAGVVVLVRAVLR